MTVPNANSILVMNLRPKVGVQMLDANIIGGGYNGLVCANYLAMQGKKVQVLERRSVVSGAAVPQEFIQVFAIL